MNNVSKYEVVVVGVSFGGPQALANLLPSLPKDFPLPIVIVQHIGSHSENFWIKSMETRAEIKIIEAEEKSVIENGVVYIAPANYHLLIESDKSFSLSTEGKINYARPSIDVLFESAARVYKEKVIGVILTGANSDGALGLKKIKEAGGLTIVQDPAYSESPSMPQAAIRATRIDFVMPLQEIVKTLLQLAKYETIR